MKVLAITAVCALGLVVPPAASAATVIGQAPPTAGTPGACEAGIHNSSVVQLSAGGNTYTVPAGGGVITEWSHLADATPGQVLRLRLFRHVAGATFTAVAESEDQTLTPSTVNTFQTRIPVSGGERVGIDNGPMGQSGTACIYHSTATAADDAYYSGNDVSPPLGSPAPYFALGQFRVNVAAVLEPDADGDGFGDETQDLCPSDATKQGDCAQPDTTITKAPPPKTKKKTATFEFTGTDARAVASFQCALDGGPFAACTSPHTVKVKKGKHVFSVRAIDANGNADPTPATQTWKVKKKKKR